MRLAARCAIRQYAAAFWVAAVGIAVMLGWLIVLGVHWWMAAAIVLFIVAAHLIVVRVVAETGLPFIEPRSAPRRFTRSARRNGLMRDIYFAAVYSVLGPLTTCDGLTTFATNGLGVCRKAGVSRAQRRKVGTVIAWTLIVGFVIAAFTTLHCQYSYPMPASQEASPAEFLLR